MCGSPKVPAQTKVPLARQSRTLWLLKVVYKKPEHSGMDDRRVFPN